MPDCVSGDFAVVVVAFGGVFAPFRPAYDRNRALIDKMLLVLSENVRGVQVSEGVLTAGARDRQVS